MAFEELSKGSLEEIVKAEETMTSQQAELSQTREDMIRIIKSESGIDPEVFDEILETFKLEKLADAGTWAKYSCKIRGHEFASLGDGNFTLDGLHIPTREASFILDKYLPTIQGLIRIDDVRIMSEAQRKVIEDVLR